MVAQNLQTIIMIGQEKEDKEGHNVDMIEIPIVNSTWKIKVALVKS